MNAGEPTILKRLAQMAIELCGADSSGVSVLEDGANGKQIFRWRALAGEFEPYEGGSTPRDWSPCGACLDAGRPMLYSYPARFFTYFQEVDTTIVEGLVIPMQDERGPIGTIWIVSDKEEHGFDAEDVRVMTSLGAFVTAALRLAERTGSCDIRSEREVVWSELVRRLSRGDFAALEPLIEETRPFVFARALRILSSPADADETAADVYLQVSNIAGRYDADRLGVLGWLLNLARSRAIDRLRARTRYDQSLEAALSVELPAGDDPESGALRDQTGAQIRGAMRTLPLEQMQAIELAYFEGLSGREIADRLGHPLGTVKSRIRKGLMSLRLLLATQ